MTYLEVGPKADNTCELLEPLLSCLLWPTERSRVGGMAIVLVQDLGDKVQVPLSEPLAPFAHEFDLRRFGVL